MSQDELKAPFPWFGGKSRAAGLIWPRLGAGVANYVEPFAGSLAILLGRPGEPGIETVNDLDGFLANFWRALAAAPDDVARHADQPVNEVDLVARHVWLLPRRAALTERLQADPTYYDAQVAGWWVWGLCCWIGGGWCSGNGPWMPNEAGDRLVTHSDQEGVNRRRVHLGSGVGVNRRRVHLGSGVGVNRTRVHLGAGDGLAEWFRVLAARLRHVRVCCGDWCRVLGPSPTTTLGVTAVVLDPPYAMSERDAGCYAVDEVGISASVREWAIEHQDDPMLRIVLCGYEGEHEMPPSWEVVEWSPAGGYGARTANGRGRDNMRRERLWFSPHCVDVARPTQADMWGEWDESAIGTIDG